MFGISNEMWTKLKSFVVECRRVFAVTKKPSKEEFKAVSKVSALGALVIGFIGFVVHFAYQMIK